MVLQRNREIATEIKETMSGKTFGEDICQLISSGHKFNHQILAKDTFANEVKINFNVLRASMKHGVRGNSESRNIVAPQNWRLRQINAKIFE